MKTSREKAALGVFALLVLGGLAILLSYIFVWGHQLNTAASTIDDAAGSLDGYTALVYKGTAEKRTETVLDAESVGALTPRSLNRQSTQESQEDKTDEVSATDASAEATSDEEASTERPATVLGVQLSYAAKEADVVVVEVEDPLVYASPQVVQAGSHSFGFLYIDEITAQERYLARRVAEYDALGVDIVVAVVSDIALLDEYAGVDIVISTQEEGLDAHGTLVGGVFYDDVPLKGQVGTILVSPSRTITAKDVAFL